MWIWCYGQYFMFYLWAMVIMQVPVLTWHGNWRMNSVIDRICSFCEHNKIECEINCLTFPLDNVAWIILLNRIRNVCHECHSVDISSKLNLFFTQYPHCTCATSFFSAFWMVSLSVCARAWTHFTGLNTNVGIKWSKHLVKWLTLISPFY